nr:hypothetical protein [Micromonospora sp. DSM 115978]
MASVVQTRCLGRNGLGRLTVRLAVDLATAKRFALTCRAETFWRRKVTPAVLVAVAVNVIAYVVDSVRNDAQYFSVIYLMALVLAFTGLAGRLALNLLHSRHHPKEVKGYVYVRDLDRGVVEIWASLNPIGAIKIIER